MSFGIQPPTIPATMRALRYEKPKDWAIVEVPVPDVGDGDVLVKINACGVCGTDLHIHDGDLPDEFPARYPLIPGHEPVGIVVKMGKNVARIALGQRVVCSANIACHDCFYCVRSELLLCENIKSHGVTINGGGFAEYCAYPSSQVHTIEHLSDLEAILVEPAACAGQMLARINPKPGSECLVFGAGPAGILLAQLLRLNGGCHVTIASLPGAKLDSARRLNAADAYIALTSTPATDPALAALLTSNPRGFDVVIEATGVSSVLAHSLDYVRRGGTLALFGVYSSSVRVSWPPARILGQQITVIGSIAEVARFSAAVSYLESKKVRVDGVANRRWKLQEWGECLASLSEAGTVKAVVVFDD